MRRALRRSARRQTPVTLSSHSWRDDELWVVDLELTGLDLRRDKIISYGAIPIRGGRIHMNEALYGLVGIDEPVPAASARIHGIRTQDLCAAPSLTDAVADLRSHIGAHPIVAHYAVIEQTLLRRAYRRCGFPLPNNFIDTAVIATEVLDETVAGGAISLEYTADALGVPVHRPHHALGDAVTTANVLLALASRTERRLGQPVPTASLIAASDPRNS